MNSTSPTITHKWEEKGFIAPYSFITLISLPHPKSQAYLQGGAQAWGEAQRYAKSLGVSIASCDICGTSLLNNFICRDATGKHFVVGCDCVEKLGDTFLTTAVEKAEKARKKALKDAQRQARWERQREERERELERQRARNNGLTDRELEERKLAQEREEAKARYSQENAWILSILEATTYISDWKSSMIHKLKREPISSFSERNRSIFADLYGRSFGRVNSKAYLTAQEEAWKRMEASK